MARPYNALNGVEIRTILGQELATAFQQDTRFTWSSPVKVTWELLFDLYQEPTEPLHIAVRFGSAVTTADGPSAIKAICDHVKHHLSLDQRFAQHLAFPKGTWSWRLPLTLEAVAGGAVTIQPQSDPDEDRIRAARLAGSEAGILAAREAEARRVGDSTVIAMQAKSRPTNPPEAHTLHTTTIREFVDPDTGQRFRMVPVDGPTTPPQPVSLAGATVLPRQVEITLSPEEDKKSSGLMRTTVNGERIEGGAKPSPGAAMADSFGQGSPAGVAQADALRQSIELGVSHPMIAEGHLGAPDKTRREVGLPIPAPVATKAGGVVDLPAGSF